MIADLFMGGRVLTGGVLAEGLAVGLSEGRIVWLGPQEQAPPALSSHQLDGDLLLPGFIDVQVNGGGGVLFNDEPSAEAIAAIGRAHYQFGTTGFLPTLISDTLEVVDAGIEAASAAIAEAVPGVLGIHIEGPFLNPRRKGIHDGAKLIPLERGLLPRLTALEAGRTVVTLAPEMVPDGLIAALSEAGVLVCAGHTEATLEQMRSAYQAGMRGVTHLFNAMPPLVNRAPGPVGAALEDQNAWCGLIVDGFHVDPAVLRLALKCRPLDRFMLVTDAMPTVGAASQEFALGSEVIRVSQGRCQSADGTLAGSALDMAGAVRGAMEQMGLSLPQAAAMASANPAAFLGLDHELGSIAPGYRASLVVASETLEVRQTWVDGIRVFARESAPSDQLVL